MKYTDFEKLIKFINETDKFIQKLHDINIDCYNTIIYENWNRTIELFIKNTYGSEGWGWFSWFVWEKMTSKHDLIATDANGNEICKTVEDLWEYLERKYKNND